MDLVLLLGRVMFAAIFLGSGLNHFQSKDELVGYAKMKGAPAPETMVPLTGAVLLLGGISVVFGIAGDLGALALFAFLVPTAFIMHAYWKVSDPQERAGEQAHFMKDIALGGGALVLFWLFKEFGDFVPYTLTGAFF